MTYVNRIRHLYLASPQAADLLAWLVFTVAGLALTAGAVRIGARLGTAGAPFLGRYRWQLTPLILLAPAVGAVTLVVARLRLRESRDPAASGVDIRGVALLSPALFLLVYALIRGNDWAPMSTNGTESEVCGVFGDNRKARVSRTFDSGR